MSESDLDEAGPLRSVAIVVLTRNHSADELTRHLGVEPTRARERRTPPAWSDPMHPTHLAWSYEVRRVDGWRPAPYLDVLRPVLQRLVDRPLVGVAAATLSVLALSRPQGYDFILDPEELVLIGRAGLHLDVDCMSTEADEADRIDA